LFATCTVDYNDPATGRATVGVLERNGVDVALPAQRCCGMPYLDGDALEEAKALIRENVMAPIAVSEILNLYEYEKVREARRAEVIALKGTRRVALGRYLSLVFENRLTVWFQIQEIIRAERIIDEATVAQEVDVYNELLPGPGELAATMMIESAEIQPVLDRLLGIDTRDYLRLEVGTYVVIGRFETGRSDEERGKISAMHFIRFPLPTEARRVFREAEVALVLDHPNEHARILLSEETKRSRADDLA
jgi:ribosomal protein S28E/S33